MLKATVCFHDDFADATLHCSAANERELFGEVKCLISETGIVPRLTHVRCNAVRTEFVVMACFADNALDADLTRRVQFCLYDWMLGAGCITKDPWLGVRKPHKHGAEYLLNRKQDFERNLPIPRKRTKYA